MFAFLYNCAMKIHMHITFYGERAITFQFMFQVFFWCHNHVKCTKYETCAKLHRFHIFLQFTWWHTHLKLSQGFFLLPYITYNNLDKMVLLKYIYCFFHDTTLSSHWLAHVQTSGIVVCHLLSGYRPHLA